MFSIKRLPATCSLDGIMRDFNKSPSIPTLPYVRGTYGDIV